LNIKAWNTTGINLQDFLKTSDSEGYFAVEEEVNEIGPPKIFLNDEKQTPINWENKKSHLLPCGFLVLNDVYWYQGYWFIREQEVQEYNFRNKSVLNNELPDHLAADIVFDQECFIPLPSKGHWRNYGCWLSQIIPQINRIRELGKNSTIVLPELNEWQMGLIRFYFQDSLKIIQLPLKSISRPQKTYFFKRIIMGESKAATIFTKKELNFIRGCPSSEKN